jgi:outer membrane protein TolC
MLERRSLTAAGAGQHQRARANYDATVANYRQTTLVAFQEVEDNMAALRILEHEAAQQKEAVAEAQRGVEIVTNRYQLGADPSLQWSPLRRLRSKTNATKSTYCGDAWMPVFS